MRSDRVCVVNFPQVLANGAHPAVEDGERFLLRAQKSYDLSVIVRRTLSPHNREAGCDAEKRSTWPESPPWRLPVATPP